MYHKDEAITNWQIPTTPKEWYRYIGFVNFLSCFIPNAASLLKPLYTHHNFIKKKENSPISEDILKSNFIQIQTALKHTVGLQLFNPNETVFIMTDASNYSMIPNIMKIHFLQANSFSSRRRQKERKLIQIILVHLLFPKFLTRMLTN